MHNRRELLLRSEKNNILPINEKTPSEAEGGCSSVAF
jgi:hypothetical protein